MATSAKAVANRLLELAARDGKSIDPLQMEKLVYLAEGFTLAVNDESLYSDDIEAWQYGPVVPDLYYALRQYGADAITAPLYEYDYETREPVIATGNFDDVERDVVDAVWENLRKLDGPRAYQAHP